MYEKINIFYPSLHPAMPRSKIYSIGQAKVTRSSDVIAHIGYTPSTTNKLKWNGKAQYQQNNYKRLKRRKEKKMWEAVQIIQVKKILLQSPR